MADKGTSTEQQWQGYSSAGASERSQGDNHIPSADSSNYKDAQAKLTLNKFSDAEDKKENRPAMPRQNSSYNDYKRDQQLTQLTATGFGDKEGQGFTES